MSTTRFMFPPNHFVKVNDCIMTHRFPTCFRAAAAMLCLMSWAVFGGVTTPATAAEPAALRVMSFNIRYGNAADGENRWSNRKEAVVKTIEAFAPDLLGTQETLRFQRDYLAEQMPQYENVGVGRVDGKFEGEMMALFFRKDRFEKLEEGHFWLSESSEKVGSISWDSSLPRMATWVRLQDKKQPNAPKLLFINTHFDHVGVVARNESAKLIRSKANELARGASIIVTGDFNAGEASEPYRFLFGEIDGEPSPLVDSLRSLRPERGQEEGTFSGFVAANQKGARIDWIGMSRDLKVTAAEIDRTETDGRTPSDHFPVTAVVH